MSKEVKPFYWTCPQCRSLQMQEHDNISTCEVPHCIDFGRTIRTETLNPRSESPSVQIKKNDKEIKIEITIKL